ncbi:MAG TPA: extracellular solute-binding protein, partial [Devosia sp.]|nr:extracellular solute-binding protein [Devosia sp.]
PIKAAWYGGQDTHDRMQKALALFTQKNPDIPVTVEFAPFGDFYDRLPVQYSGGGAPDMHRHSMTYLFDYIERGLLADLTPFIGKTIDTASLYPGVVEIGTMGDTVNAIGNNQIAVGLFYNQAKLNAAGITGKLDDLTWDSFREMAIALGQAGGDQHYGTNDAGGFAGIFEVFLTQRGKSLYTAESGLGFEKADLIDWLAFWQSMRAERGAPPPAVTAESAGFQNAPMVRDLAAMQIGWNQQLVFYQALMTTELGIHACPSLAGGANNGHLIRALDFWVCPAKSSHVEQSAKLIDFLLNDDEAIAILGLTLGGPASDKAAAILAKTADAPSAKVLQYLDNLRAVASPDTPRWIKGHGELESLLNRLNGEVGFERTTPEAAADTYFDEADFILG